MFAHVCACVRVGVGVGVCARLCLCCVPTCLHACMHVLCVYVGSENRVYPKSNGLSSFSLLNGHVGGYPIFRHTNVWVCMCARAECAECVECHHEQKFNRQYEEEIAASHDH